MNTQQHPTREDLIDFQHRELDAGRDVEILAHLEECAACAAVHDEEARLGEWLRSHARSEVLELPLGFASATLARAQMSEPRSFGDLIGGWLRPAIALPAAAFLLLLAILGPAMLPRLHRNPAQVSALYDLRDHAALMATEPFAGNSQAPIMLANDSNNGAP